MEAVVTQQMLHWCPLSALLQRQCVSGCLLWFDMTGEQCSAILCGWLLWEPVQTRSNNKNPVPEKPRAPAN